MIEQKEVKEIAVRATKLKIDFIIIKNGEKIIVHTPEELARILPNNFYVRGEK